VHGPNRNAGRYWTISLIFGAAEMGVWRPVDPGEGLGQTALPVTTAGISGSRSFVEDAKARNCGGSVGFNPILSSTMTGLARLSAERDGCGQISDPFRNLGGSERLTVRS
jgi:hypothetical protein